MRLILFLILSSYGIAQETYHGVVRNEANEPIDGVVLTVFKSEDPAEVEHILITDDNGLFQLDLKPNTLYIISTRHLSYQDNSILVNTSKRTAIEIILKSADNILDEIIIKHERPKITIKRDTVSYDIARYIDSNDRKLKDLVEKLPGITLQEDGTLYFKGEKITKLLVENQEFFGGGTKLGLDNIPADAIEKLEVIANYSKSKLLQNSRRTEAQVMNLVLKEDRKSIVFGNADVASNFDEFYKLHASVFQFLPKQQNNFIGDINNVAEQSLSNNESMSFSDVDSELFKLPEIPIDYNTNDRDYSEISNQLIMANIKRMKEYSTWDIIGFYTQSKKEQRLFESQEYFNNDSFENTDESERNQTNNIYLKASNYYQTPKKERVLAIILNFKDSEKLNQTLSNSNFGARDFINDEIDGNFILGALLEEIRPLKNNDYIVYGLKGIIENGDNTFLLNSNEQFLNDILPWTFQNKYTLLNPNDLVTRTFETGATYYKSVRRYHTLTASSKWIFELSNSNNDQKQQLDDASETQFPDLFNSQSNLRNFQLLNRLNYRFDKDKWDLNLGVEFNTYNISFENKVSKSSSAKLTLNPFLNTRYHINNKKQIAFSYKKSIQLPLIAQLDNFLKIQGYTSIVVGNPELNNSINHYFSVNYSDYNIHKNYSFQTNQNLTIYEKALSTTYDFNDINSIATYFTQKDAGFVFQTRNSFFYLFDKWEIGLRLNYTKKRKNTIV